MSSNRLIYDTCAYKHELSQSVGPLEYVLNPMKFENCNKCRMELGLVGGSAVSHVKGNLVDLETDLRGQTRRTTKCPTRLYQNPCPTGDMNNCKPGNIHIRGDPSQTERHIDTQMLHLPSCQMIRYKPIPLPPALDFDHSNFQQSLCGHSPKNNMANANNNMVNNNMMNNNMVNNNMVNNNMMNNNMMNNNMMNNNMVNNNRNNMMNNNNRNGNNSLGNMAVNNL